MPSKTQRQHIFASGQSDPALQRWKSRASNEPIMAGQGCHSTFAGVRKKVSTVTEMHFAEGHRRDRKRLLGGKYRHLLEHRNPQAWSGVSSRGSLTPFLTAAPRRRRSADFESAETVNQPTVPATNAPFDANRRVSIQRQSQTGVPSAAVRRCRQMLFMPATSG